MEGQNSKYISVKVLAERLNIQDIEAQARDEWLKQQRGRRRLEQRLIQIMPGGLVLMVAVFYGLSAPHTAHLLSLITPNFVGQYFAPIGFELGVLIVSALRELGWKNSLTVVILWALLLLSILINIAGGFIAVVSSGVQADISAETFSALLGRFGTLSAATQVVLLLVIPIGSIIPIMSKLAGEAVVKLALGKVRLERQSDEERWAMEGGRVMYSALLQAALKIGAGVKTAGNWAQVVVDEMYAYRAPEKPARALPSPRDGQSGTVPRLSSAALEIQSPAHVSSFRVQSDKDDEKDGDSPRIKKGDVIDWLKTNGLHDHLSDREVAKLYTQARFGVASDSGYKTIQRARKELKGE